MLRGLFFILTLAMVGCVSLEPAPDYGVRLTTGDWPLLALQKLVASELPVGLRNNSPNGREFYSRYYIVDDTSYKAAAEATDRYTAKVVVLGSERPYQLEITVDHERRRLHEDDFNYDVVGHDKRLAQELAYKLHDILSKRREERNVIDDFRVF